MKNGNRKIVRRLALVVGVLLIALLITGELGARYYLGLGDPPLSQADPTIEYLFQPNQDGYRFGNHFHYNAHSMRSDDFPQQKTDPHELRVLVVGDSVVNGGSQTDQKDLATSILQHDLAARLRRPVVVGNISAGNWGPPNQLAYLKKYGLFDADVVVLVLGSGDAYDVPTFAPTVGVHPSFPDHRPWSALQEGLTRYLPGYLHAHFSSAQPMPQGDPMGYDTEENKRICLQAVQSMYDMAQAQHATFLVALHWSQEELDGKADDGYPALREKCRELRIEPILLAPLFTQARQQGPSPYRDNIHPNAVGQAIMAKAIGDAIVGDLSEP